MIHRARLITDDHRENANVDPNSNDIVPEPGANIDEKRLQSICLSLRELRSTMVDTFQLPSGRVLEDFLFQYASGLTELDPAHCFIVDKRMLPTLGRVDSGRVLSRVRPLPVFPEVLDRLLDKYKGVTTVAQCREIAGISLDEDVLWIGRVLEHMLATPNRIFIGF